MEIESKMGWMGEWKNKIKKNEAEVDDAIWWWAKTPEKKKNKQKLKKKKFFKKKKKKKNKIPKTEQEQKYDTQQEKDHKKE